MRHEKCDPLFWLDRRGQFDMLYNQWSHISCRTLLSKISIHIVVKVCWPNWPNSHKIAQICSKLHKVAQICSKLRKVAMIHTKPLKVAQICPKLHKVTQICPNYTLIEILLKKVRLEKCDPWFWKKRYSGHTIRERPFYYDSKNILWIQEFHEHLFLRRRTTITWIFC